MLASSNKPPVVQARFFEVLSASEISRSVGALANHPHFRSAIQLSRNDLSSFYRHRTPSSPLDKNIAWCLGLLDHHSEKVQFLLDRESRLVQFLLRDDHEECVRILDEIDAFCGDSLWSVGLRGSLLTAHGSLEAKRDFLTALAERSGDNRFMKATARFVASRYDDTGLLSPEYNALEQKIKRGFGGELLHFLMHKVVPPNFNFEYDFAHILNFEKDTSPIDIYKCLCDMACYCITALDESKYFHQCQGVVRALSRLFKTSSLRGLCNYYGIPTDWEFEWHEYQILDLYTSGNYQAVCDQMQNNPSLSHKFTLFELWARAASRTGATTEGQLGDLLKSTCSVMLKNETYDKSVASLLMRAHAFGMLPWFKELQHLVIRETRFVPGKNEKLALASIVLSQVDSPARARAMSPDLRHQFTAAMLNCVPSSTVVKLYGASGGHVPSPTTRETEGVESLRATKFCAKYHLEQGNYEQAIPLLTDLTKQIADSLTKHEAARLLVSAYISGGRPEEATKTYVDTVMANPHLLRTFDSNAICSVCEGLATNSKSISVPISLSLHSRFVNEDYSAALRYSFERFLQNNEVQFPLELIHLAGIEKAQLLYFLEHVCIPDVMKLYLLFDTSKDIERYRIEICKKLIEMGHSVDEMVYEVKERTRHLVILEATKHVENSRIYADTSAFGATAEFREIYERFVTLRTKDYSSEPDEIALSSLFETVRNESVVMSNAYALHVQDIVLNEKNLTFLKLCKLMRDEFTFGVKGLNGHLSTRIRHGHFPNTIRKCVSDEGLFSPKTRATGGYKRAAWADRFRLLPAASVNSIDKSFAEFSSKYESLIEEVNDKWFQINVFDQDMSGLEGGKISGDALFNYSTTAFEAYCIERQVPLTADYSAFVKVITQWLWDRTERNLRFIRERINADFRDRAYRLLDSLEGEVFRVLVDQEEMSKFSDAVGRARTRLGAAIESIIGWFTKSEGLTVPLFDSEVAVTIASLSAGAQLEHSDTTGIQFQGRALSYLVDVLYVLLENCVTKSNLQRDDLKIVARLERDEFRTVLSVVNNCSAIVDVERANDTLAYYRDSYGKEMFAWKAAQGEGGSGLFKVWKALAKDLELAHEIEFGYESNDQFKVSISIDNNELEKVRHHENFDHRG